MPRYETYYDPATAPAGLQFVRYEKSDHIAWVTISRPEVRNALHSYAYAELNACWRDISRDPDIYCGVVAGDGPAFCAGRDIKFLAEYQREVRLTPHEDPNSPMYHWGGGGQPQDVELDKPLICAINGFAVGVGLSIAMQCQLRVMAEDAWLGDQHTNVGRLGAPHEIYHRMPQAIAAYLTLCNGRLTAAECLRLGLVNKVVPQEDLLEAARELALMVCRNSPLAVQGAVRLYRLTSGFSEPLTDYARHLDKEIAESDDGAEGSRAFASKRRPVWQGR